MLKYQTLLRSVDNVVLRVACIAFPAVHDGPHRRLGPVPHLATRLISSYASKRAPPIPASVVPIKDFSEMPGPPEFPVIGSFPTMIAGGFEPSKVHMFWNSLFEKYGPIVKLKIPGYPYFVGMSNPDDIELVMKSTLQNPVREAFFSLEKVRKETANNFFNNKTGILIENGEEWWRVRSRVQAPLLKPKNVAMYLPKVDRTTNLFMERIEALQSKTGRVPDNFLEEIYKWALECVGLVALDKQLGCLDPDILPDSRPMKLIETAHRLLAALNVTEMNFHWWKLYKTKAYSDLEESHAEFLKLADESIEEAILSLKETQASGDANRRLTVMETFLQTEGLSKSDVATMVLDLLFAGIDTTSHSVVFSLYALAKNPDCQMKLQKEVDTVMGDSEELLPEHIASMTYLNRVLKETLRFLPLFAGTMRTLNNELVLSGYRVPQGVSAFAFSLQTNRNERYFKRQSEFIPERWDRDRPLGAIHPYASLPFSTGTRMCIGKRIAEQEIYNFLIRAMQKYTVTFESNDEMEVENRMIFRPIIPLAFKFHPRT